MSRTIRTFSVAAALFAVALLFPVSSEAQEVNILDKITGFNSAATNALNNQTAGAGGGRQILFSPHTFTQTSQVTRFQILSNPTVTPANGFSYSVRDVNAPFTELFSGTATRISRTAFPGVTFSGNNTNLDEFQITGLILDPGTYFIAVHASDGNAYQIAANSGLVPEPLLAENGGVPFLAGANFHLYTSLFAILLQDEIVARATSNFLSRRADQITANAPNLSDRLSSRVGNRSNGPAAFTADGTAQDNQFSFSTSLLEFAGTGAAQQGNVHAFGPQPVSASFAAGDETGLGFWVHGSYAHLDSATSDNDLGQFYAGVDYRLNPGLVIGALAQFDWSDEGDGANNASLEGTGWLVGPYLVARVHDHVIFDALATYGRSDNDVVAGGATGTFEAERFYVKGQLTGDYDAGGWHFAPHVALHYFEEDQDAFTNSLGGAIASQTVSLGRFTFGPEVSTDFVLDDGTRVSPRLALKGLWDFERTTTVNPTTGLAVGTDDLRARIEGALSFQMNDGLLINGGLYYDGIGASNFDAYGGSLSVTLLLN